MPLQSMPKEGDSGEVALSPEKQIYEDIYQRVLSEVRARIDQRIADMEVEAVASEHADGVELSAVSDEHTGANRSARRRPLLRVAVNLVASAVLIGAVVTLARTHQTEAIAFVTDRIDAAIQSVRESLPKTGSIGGPETASSSSDVARTATASPSLTSPSLASPPSVSPLADAAAARSGDPLSAMAEASPEREAPSAGEHDLAPLIEKIAHDVGRLQVRLQDLKTSQEQASRDHIRAIEQLQASQDHLARALRAARTEPPGGAAVTRFPTRPAQASRFP